MTHVSTRGRSLKIALRNDHLGVARRVLSSALAVVLGGCTGPTHTEVVGPGPAPPSITITLPAAGAKFSVGQDVPLKVVVNAPPGQGEPMMIARIMQKKVIATETLVGGPAVVANGEQTYEIVFREGVSRPGKYEIVVEGSMGPARPDGPAAPNKEPERRLTSLQSNKVALEVTK